MRTSERLHHAAMTGSLFRKLALTIALVTGALVASSRSAEAQAPAEPTDDGGVSLGPDVVP